MKLRSLSSRIAWMLAVAVTLIVGSAGLLMDHLIDAQLRQRFDASLLSQAHALAALVEVDGRGPDMEDLRHIPSRLLLGDQHAAYAVRCDGSYRMQSQPPPRRYPPDWLQSASAQPQFADLSVSEHDLRAVWFRFQPGQGDARAGAGMASCSMILLQPSQELDDILVALDLILLTVPLLALMAVIVLTPALVRRGLQPLADLGERMSTIGPSEPDARLPSGETHELVPLVDRFNAVLERMQAGMQRERRFAGALAHETRTRLAELRTLVDVELRHPSGRPVPQVLAEIGTIGGELEDTVTGLLLLTRLEAGIETIRWQRMDLADVVHRQVEAVGELTRLRQIRIELSAAPAPVSLVGDASVFGIVLGNLLRNAAAYAPRGSKVRLAWNTTMLELDNDAPELSEDDVAQFGIRYWRKAPHDMDHAHAGLGLSLAYAAAAALELDLSFTLGKGHRLLARLAWPDARVI